MEDLERKVIRRKKGAFMEHLQVTDDFLDELRVKQIFPVDAMDAIEAEKINGARVTKLLDCVLATPDPRRVLSSVLLKDYAWLSRDLEAEILAERGTLEIEEDILRETGMMVHRKFGSSKRLCETDKREIQELMALKLQIAKGEFQQELGNIKQALDDQTKINVNNEKRATKLIQTTKTYLKKHDRQLNTHAHGLLSTKDVLQLTMAEMALSSLEKYEKYHEYVLNKFSLILNQRDLLLSERDRCLRLLNANKEEDSPLDEVLRRYQEEQKKELQRATLTENNANGTLGTSNSSDSSKVIKRLNGKIADMETALDEKDDMIKQLRQEVARLESAKAAVANGSDLENGENAEEDIPRKSSSGNIRKKAAKRGSVSKPKK